MHPEPPPRPSDSVTPAQPADLTIFRTGDEYFPPLLRALREAKSDVIFEVYIFRDDNTGKKVAAELRATAERGVRVRLLLDAWGCNTLPDAFLADLRRSGVEILLFSPVGRLFWRVKKHLRRMHRKVVVVDDQVAFVGGINVLDEQVTTSGRKPLFDYAIAVQGALVSEIRRNSEKLWKSANAPRSFFSRSLRHERLGPAAKHEVGDAWFVSRDNHRNRAAIEEEYIRLIDAARDEIIIASAYFFPYRNLRAALERAARRGVKVKLLLQGLVDVVLIRYATKYLYKSLLRAGFEVYEDDCAVVHAKVATFDREYLTVGSSNLDPLSLGLTLEANVFSRAPHLASQLAIQLDNELRSSCTRILAEKLQETNVFKQLLWRVSYITVRFLSKTFVLRV